MNSGDQPPGAPGGPSTVRRALAAIEQLQARLIEAERIRTEPIAIVGLGCRLPGGASTPESYWQLLVDGVDAVREVPPERWNLSQWYDPDPAVAGRMYSRHGGFLDDVAGFDAGFFRISPREAQSMDPQQRLLLEVTWEALEDAGLAPDQLRGSATGVFVGLTTTDYAHLLLQAGPGALDAHFFTGNPANAAAGRIAYTYGFRGPAVAIDTACSSSLVALHQACASLRLGECRVALAGGVNLVLAPETTVAVCRTRALSPDGRCRTFGADANGFVRSEGCGILVLKRLSTALEDGDRIRAVIRGSAVNQDGASSGFTVPSGTAQQDVIRLALGALSPASVDYLEAHGTGTPLGDPVEVAAAAAVLGEGRQADRPLYIGSAKANIGHAEAAAGVAAVIKAVLALEHAEIPPHLAGDALNPHIDWATLPLRVPRTRVPWPDRQGVRRAGVSAFGASGTNAHAVLEQAPAVRAPEAQASEGPWLLLLSARSRAALLALARRYAASMASLPPDDLSAFCTTAATRRAHLPERAALVVESREDACRQLEALIERLLRADTPPASAVIAPGVGFFAAGVEAAPLVQHLSSAYPAFRQALERDDQGGTPESAFSDLLRAWGLEPTAMPDLDGVDAADTNPRGRLWRLLAAAYLGGAAPDWKAVMPAARPVPLPLYPFQHTPYWIPVTQNQTSPAITAVAAPDPGTTRTQVLERLRGHIAGLLQAPASEISVELPFLEMGADSLVMVDAIGIIEKEFGVKLAIRRFFEDLSSIDALATHIAAVMPAPAAPTPVSLPSAPAATPALSRVTGDPAGGTTLERLLVEQTRLMAQFMAQQNDILRLAVGGAAGASGGATAPVATEPPTPMPATAAPRARPAATSTPATGDDKARPMMPFGNPVEVRGRGLNETQREHLEALITRYTARTAESKRRTQEYRPVLADSRTTVGFRLSTKEMLYPIWGDRTAGSRLWDVDGNEYIDYTMGFGVHLFGHAPGFIQDSVREEFERAVELGARSPLVGEVASLMTELTGLDRVAFSNSGTEAVMAAVRLARAATGREKIVLFTNAYHGHSDITLARAQEVNGRLSSVPMAPGVPAGIAGDVVVLEYGSDEALEIIRRRGHEIAAVMVEPVQSRHLTLQPRAFLHALRSLTTEIGAALIFDEMITGFRADIGGAQGYFGVKADLATYGKIVGGGLPIGLVAGSREFMDGIDGGMWQYGDASFPAADRTAFGGTFCQHPLSMAGAAAVLRKLKAEGPGLQHRLNERTNRLVLALNRHFQAEELPIEATNFSSLFRFEFSSNLDLLFYHMLERGIYIWEWRSCFLSTAHTDDDVQRFVDVVQESLDELRRGGFATRPTGRGRNAPPARAPLTRAQQQMALLLQIEPTASQAYNVSTTVDVSGPLDAAQLRSALQRVVNRHAALRSTLTPDGTEQYVHATVDMEIPVTDLSSEPAETRETALGAWMDTLSREPLDLFRGPVCRARLARLADDQHVLVLTVHHLFADGMTVGLILKELAAYYNEPSVTLPAPMQFPAYVEQMAALRASGALAPHEQFWRETFADGVPQVELPVDRVRPATKTYAGARITQHLDPAVVEALRRLSREQGCTLNMTLLAAFSLLLHRYTDADDLVVGTSVAGRPFPGSMEMAGYCTHLVPIRSRLDGDPSFVDLLSATRRRLLDVFDHQDLPFADLLDLLPVPRSSGAFPLISAVFNMEPVSALPALRGLSLRPRPQTVNYTPFDLFVNVTDGGVVVVETDYNAALFEGATVERLLANFAVVLGAVTAAPTAPVRHVAVLTAAERTRVLETWNDTACPFAPAGFVPALIEAVVARQPTAVAVALGTETLTYGALNTQANQLAHWLQGQGVGPDVPVGICCERSLAQVVALLAVLKAGGAYVPLDPAYPAARLAAMVADAAPPVVLLQARWAATLAVPAGTTVLRLDEAGAGLAGQPTHNPAGPTTGAQLAYIIYTSGSTGQPKGALNTHAGLRNRLLWMQATYGLQADDRVLQKTPFSFDVSVWEYLWPLLTGARLVLAAPGGHRDPRYLVDLIATAGITTVHFVPSLLQLFLEEPGLARCTGLRRVLASGEALTPELVRRSAEVLPAPLHNLYGPTEASIDVTAWPCDVATLGATVPIGRPIANTRIYLLDRAGEPVPQGATGELYIGGVGVGRGYWQRPAQTAAAFVPDPFRPADWPGTLYRTGDLARYRASGDLEYLGRRDHQVKVRGFRIELGEIEARLTEQPGVAAAVVVAETLPSGDKRLVAYVVAPTLGADAAAVLRTGLARVLPDYMVPGAVVSLPDLPRLPNGKVDRSRLPEAPSAQATHDAPSAGVESAIAAVWEEVLRQAPVGATDDFFALGGNSLSAAQVVSRLVQRLGARLSIRDLFAYPTVRALAAALALDGPQSLPEVVPQDDAPDHPVSRAQRRFWIQERLATPGLGNAHPAVFRIDGPLDTRVLRTAFDHLLVRHEILRTQLVEVAGGLRQRVQPPSASAWEWVALGSCEDEGQLDSVVDAVVRRDAARRMDLGAGPLVRVTLLPVGPEAHICICSLHHAVTDGWSIGVLLHDLTRLYDALLDGRGPALAPLPFQYRDYAAWHERVLEDTPALRDYWTTRLTGVPALALPGSSQAGRGWTRATWRFAIDPPLVAGLENVARQQGATLFMALLAAFRVTLYRHTGREDFCIGSPVAGRVRSDFEPQVGPYMNVVALRDRVQGADTFAAVLAASTQTTLDALAHQLYPFDLLVDELHLRREPGRNPLFDVGLTLQNQEDVLAAPASRSLRLSRLDPVTDAAVDAEAATDVWLVVTRADDGLAVETVYNGARFEQAFIRTLGDDLRTVVATVVAQPDVPVRAIPLAGAPQVSRRVAVNLGL